MATFLELCQEARALSGVAGTGPASVLTATGIELRIVNYVKNAWIDIQAHPKKWKWMLGDYLPVGGNPLQTIAATEEYVLTDVNTIRTNTFRSYLTATGTTDRQRMKWVPWNQFRNSFQMYTGGADSRPTVATRNPGSGNLILYPTPDAVYSIEFEYQKTPQILAANADVPELPARYHQLIVYEALKRFGNAEDAPEILALGEVAGGSDGNEGRPVSGLWRALVWDQENRDFSDNAEDEQMVVRAV